MCQHILQLCTAPCVRGLSSPGALWSRSAHSSPQPIPTSFPAALSSSQSSFSANVCLSRAAEPGLTLPALISCRLCAASALLGLVCSLHRRSARVLGLHCCCCSLGCSPASCQSPPSTDRSSDPLSEHCAALAPTQGSSQKPLCRCRGEGEMWDNPKVVNRG